MNRKPQVGRRPRAFVAALLFQLLFGFGGLAAAADQQTVQPLVVGTKHSPPFAFKTEDGEWTGISIELWKELAESLDLPYELRELSLTQILSGLENGSVDVGVAAISVTAERHERVDFCHPHFTTGLGIAVSAERRGGTWGLFRSIVSTRLLATVAVMIGLVLGCGILIWLVERRRNESMFGGLKRQGIGLGMWWATILLLGHKGVVPVSLLGRVLTAGVMLTSILLLSTLTGVIASVLTVGELEAGITEPADLRHHRVVTVASSTSADYLRRRRWSFRTRPTAEQAIASVIRGDADAVVYDEALLKYMACVDSPDRINVLPVSFNIQEYAIALRRESPYRKPLNEALLRYRASDSWDELIYRYLGD